jgi:hypothetical protein
MTCFLVIPFLVSVFSYIGWWERSPRYLCSLTFIHGWWLGHVTGEAHNQSIRSSFSQMFGVNSRSYPTSINTTTLRMGLRSSRGVCSNNMRISSEHTCSSIWWDHGSLSPSPLFCWSWFPSFCW